MTVKLYGLKTCDTCRKALAWLKEQGIEVVFSDIRAAPLTQGKLESFGNALGWERLINRRSTTWRSLDAGQKNLAETDPAGLLGAQASLMKRPVIETQTAVFVGFDDETRRALSR